MADSDTTQPERITISLEAFNELKALTENIRAKAAAREAAAREDKAFNELKDLTENIRAKAADREAKAAAREAKAAAREAEAKADSMRKANPPPSVAELACVGFLFGSLAARAFL